MLKYLYCVIYITSLMIAGQVCELPNYNKKSVMYLIYAIFKLPITILFFPVRKQTTFLIQVLIHKSRRRGSKIVPGLFMLIYIETGLMCILTYKYQFKVGVNTFITSQHISMQMALGQYSTMLLILMSYRLIFMRTKRHISKLENEEKYRNYIIKSYQYDFFFYQIMPCEACEMIKIPRWSHCNVCNCCMPRKDHHCMWVNTCIFQAQQLWFNVFLTGCTTICALIVAENIQLQQKCNIFYKQIDIPVKHQYYFIINAVFYSILVIIGLMQSLIHWNNMIRNITLNEHAKREHLCYGLSKNTIQMFLLESLIYECNNINNKKKIKRLQALIFKYNTKQDYDKQSNYQDNIPVYIFEGNIPQDTITIGSNTFKKLDSETATTIARTYNFYNKGVWKNIIQSIKEGFR